MKKKTYWLAIMIIVLLIVGGCGSGSKDTEPQKEAFTVGSIVATTSAADNIICATTQDNYKELWKYLVAKDKVGVEEMLKQGKIYLLETGTEVKVIQATFNGIEVRVTEGPHKDKIAWVALDFLEK